MNNPNATNANQERSANVNAWAEVGNNEPESVSATSEQTQPTGEKNEWVKTEASDANGGKESAQGRLGRRADVLRLVAEERLRRTKALAEKLEEMKDREGQLIGIIMEFSRACDEAGLFDRHGDYSDSAGYALDGLVEYMSDYDYNKDMGPFKKYSDLNQEIAGWNEKRGIGSDQD